MSRNSRRSAGIADAEIFTVSTAMSFFSWLICEHPRVWRMLGNAESSILADRIATTEVCEPVWVTGLARAGSTLLLEILAGAPGVASQTYKDFPPVFTPYAWNRFLEHATTGVSAPVERAHKDGVLVTQDSPEAMEEPLWMSFFPDAHNPLVSNVIPPGASDVFAEFLRNHIRKLLAAKNKQRYLAKANYQITRMEYLLDVFPDARFVVPVRDPVAHIASLIKQHDLFTRGQRANRRARLHLRRVGHFEFGLDRTPINPGNTAATKQIIHDWDTGNDVRGWARYWASIHSHMAERLMTNDRLRDSTHIVSFEALCREPAAELQAMFAHCSLQPDNGYLEASVARIKPPTYYQPDFGTADLRTIERETSAAREQLESLPFRQS